MQVRRCLSWWQISQRGKAVPGLYEHRATPLRDMLCNCYVTNLQASRAGGVRRRRCARQQRRQRLAAATAIRRRRRPRLLRGHHQLHAGRSSGRYPRRRRRCSGRRQLAAAARALAGACCLGIASGCLDMMLHTDHQVLQNCLRESHDVE